MSLVPLDPALTEGPVPFWIEAFGLGPSFPVGGATTTVTWAYIETGATPGNHPYRALNAAERANIAVSLERVAEGTGLRFVEAPAAQAQMLIGASSDTDETAFGLAWQSTTGPVHVVAIDTPAQYGDRTDGLATNDYIYVHEIIHGVGLDHATRAFGSVRDVVIPDDLDNGTTLYGNWTVAWEQSTQLFDLARLQFVYGPDPEMRAGNDTYAPIALGAYDPETDSQAHVPLLWDGGGRDVLDLSEAAGPVDAALAPGYISRVDTANTGILEAGTFSINHKTVIETLLGSDHNDTLGGSDRDDVIDAGAGRDTVTGGFGADLLRGGLGNDVIAGDRDAPEALTPYRPGDGVQVITAAQTGAVDLENGWSLAPNADILRATERPWQSVTVTGSGQPAEAIRFQGIAGETWIFDVDDSNFDTTLELLSPGGQRLAFNDDADPGLGGSGSTSSSDSFLAVELTETGSYLLLLDVFGDGAVTGAMTATIQISNADAVLSVPGGADTLVGGPGNDSLMGEGGDDSLTGGQGFDTAMGGSGHDTLRGLDGFDRLEGGDGADLLLGNFGNDTLMGDDGADTLEGGLGFDSLNGGAGNDLIVARDGFDILQGGLGNDTLQGNNGNDRLFGGSGADSLEGGLGADTLAGGAGDDTLLGANGFDRLAGEAGDDLMVGGAGNDTLAGGAGADTLRGGLGADMFVFDGGADRITDFQNNIDALEIAAALLRESNPDPDDLRGYSRLDGEGHLVLDFGGGAVLTLVGVGTTGAILDDVSFV
ncbi:hypothetical protein [Cognatishimia sp. F0-27]|uniref:hypothetical protein n=1 Tax=Cognatishimia sp. F0-27 TaxID=2816855 RepID=UPI001D0C0148|nr:hypothetical protein [Cognatishimia sp. F0-27]MCC1495088.1 hypothetical protein [Cognatishimia sp. F0-27]